MSVAGLRYSRSTYSSTPLETRSGSYIYDGTPSTFHDWEFRTSMRLKLYEDAIRSKPKKTVEPEEEGSDDESRIVEQSPTAGATAPVPPEDRPDIDAAEAAAAASDGGSRRRPSAPKSPDSVTELPVADEMSSYAIKARTEMVHKVLEGLRDEAFELARDIGIESLTAPGGLRDFITKLRNVVFPRATEEARELFRAGQKQGVLARQGGESMLSYVSRRRRWWKLLKTLDASIELSEPMRVELLLELSGNAAEHATAVTSAYKGKLDLAIGVAVGSSTQIALFVVPVAVLAGWAYGTPMSLNFRLFDTACQMLSVFLVSQAGLHSLQFKAFGQETTVRITYIHTLTAGVDGEHGPDVQEFVVKVFSVHSSQDPQAPWSNKPQEETSGSGCVILHEGKECILTNAHVVADATYVEVRKAGDAMKYPALRVKTSHECDLALLRQWPRSVEGKHVLITGGSQGLGLAFAKLCFARGARVTIVARTKAKLEQACEEARSQGAATGRLLRVHGLSRLGFREIRAKPDYGFSRLQGSGKEAS
ncbi:CAX4 [Symbiodinium sp. CCMP2592]|nr:CAX4 [Symbiodinium sp. CCMP2592]